MEELLFGIDPLSRVFVAAFVIVGFPCLIYLLSLQIDAQLAVAAIAFIASALGVVIARDFFWFLIFWELTVIAACYLVFSERTPSGVAVAYRYFLVQLVAGTSLFFAVALQYDATGSFEMDAVVPAAMPFFLGAFLIKAAVVPFHVWVPLTYPCVPPAVAVILSAYATKIGIYAFARLLPGIPWLAYAGAVMALFGVAMALRQRTARRLLSYQHISQIGFLITGIGVGTEWGIGGGMLHATSHMVYMSLLFMAAGAVLHRNGSEVMDGVGGVGKAMPLTFAAALTGAAAISGLPPLNGYVTKTLLKTATEGRPVLQGAFFLAAVGTAFVFAGFIGCLFLHKPSADVPPPARPKQLPLGARLAMGMLALLCLGQGVFYRQFFALASDTAPYPVYGWNQVWVGALPVFVGVVCYALARGASPAVVGRQLARAVHFLAPAVLHDHLATPDSRRHHPPDEPPLRDVNLVYAWLLHRALRLAQSVAARATDETQAYLLVITALLMVLVVFLWW